MHRSNDVGASMIEALEERRMLSATPVAALADVDTTAPQIVSVRVVGGPFRASAIQIKFSEPLNPGRAENKDNYIVAGKFIDKSDGAWWDELPDDDLFFDPNDVRLRLPIDRAIYDTSTNTVTLEAEREFKVARSMRVIKVRSGADGIKDLAGNTLDGDKNGIAGGIAIMRFKPSAGKNVKYIDQDGDRVRLSLRGGGNVFVLQQLNPHKNANSGEAIQVWLVGNVRATSTLRGTVEVTRRGGDTHARIRELLWTDPAQLDILDDTRFTIDEVGR
jgi:hypothetical protein